MYCNNDVAFTKKISKIFNRKLLAVLTFSLIFINTPALTPVSNALAASCPKTKGLVLDTTCNFVNLSPYFNQSGFSKSGESVGAGFDGNGNTFSLDNLTKNYQKTRGSVVKAKDGISFKLSDSVKDNFTAVGQSISIPENIRGKYDQISFLAASDTVELSIFTDSDTGSYLDNTTGSIYKRNGTYDPINGFYAYYAEGKVEDPSQQTAARLIFPSWSAVEPRLSYGANVAGKALRCFTVNRCGWEDYEHKTYWDNLNDPTTVGGYGAKPIFQMNSYHANRNTNVEASIRNIKGEIQDFSLYQKSFLLDPNRTLKSITLPDMPHLHIFAISLSWTPDPQPANNSSPTPPMGMNTWVLYANFISENLLKGIIDSFKATGIDQLGYNYVNLDDNWEDARGRNVGGLIDSSKDVLHKINYSDFIKGIPYLADYAHSKGLKFGIYSANSAVTCLGNVASGGFFNEDAKTFKAWHIDYLKFDDCPPKHDPWAGYEPGGVLTNSNANFCDVNNVILHTRGDRRMVQEILNTGQKIIFAASAPAGYHEVCGDGSLGWQQSVREVSAYSQLWRSAGDNDKTWINMLATYDVVRADMLSTNKLQSPGHWHDLDLLNIGLTKHYTSNEKSPDFGRPVNLFEMDRTQFSLWSMAAAPLLLPQLPSEMAAESQTLIKNTDIIAIDQDSLGVMAYIVTADHVKGDVLERNLSDGNVAVQFFNRLKGPQDMSINFSDLQFKNPNNNYASKTCQTASFKNLWTKSVKTLSSGQTWTERNILEFAAPIYKVTCTV